MGGPAKVISPIGKDASLIFVGLAVIVFVLMLVPWTSVPIFGAMNNRSSTLSIFLNESGTYYPTTYTMWNFGEVSNKLEQIAEDCQDAMTIQKYNRPITGTGSSVYTNSQDIRSSPSFDDYWHAMVIPWAAALVLLGIGVCLQLAKGKGVVLIVGLCLSAASALFWILLLNFGNSLMSGMSELGYYGAFISPTFGVVATLVVAAAAIVFWAYLHRSPTSHGDEMAGQR